MKTKCFTMLLFVFANFNGIKEASAQTKSLKLVFIRHGENR